MKTQTLFFKLFLSLTVTVTIILTVTSCEGPAGPQGPMGEQGARGEEGTANVFYSEWLEVEWNGADESDYKRMDIIEPMITEEFMSNGTVLMYLESSGVVFALPFTTATGQVFSFFMRPDGFSASLPGTFPEESGLSFFIQRDGGVASGGLDGIRYVLIPDGMPAKMSSGFWENYEAVAEYFRIQE